VPVPVRLTDWVLPATPPLSSVATSVALRLPVADGLKVTLIEQLAFAASVLPQVVLDSAKSEALVPENPRVAMFKVAFPVSLKATVRGALVVVTGWLPKAKLLGERLATAAALAPVPVRLTICGLSLALSVMVSAALRFPGPVGVNVTLIVQPAPAATELPQVVVSGKSPALPPVTAKLVMLKAEFPLFVRVSD